MPHDIRHDERISIVGYPAHGTGVPARQIMGSAVDPDRQARVINGFIEQALRLDALSTMKVGNLTGKILKRLAAAKAQKKRIPGPRYRPVIYQLPVAG